MPAGLPESLYNTVFSKEISLKSLLASGTLLILTSVPDVYLDFKVLSKAFENN